MRIIMAQQNALVGDIEGNAQRVIEAADEARRLLGADLVVFPELMLTGYPPEDLLPITNPVDVINLEGLE